MKFNRIADRHSPLSEGIARWEGRHLDGASASWPALLPSSGLGLLRVTELARFWPDGTDAVAFLEIQMVTLLAGLAAQACPFCFGLTEQNGRLSLVFGTATETADNSEICAALEAAFPGCKIGNPPDDRELQMQDFSFAAKMTGNPALESAKSQAPVRSPLQPRRLEVLARSLHGRRWAYVVCAWPVAEQQADAAIRVLNDN